MTPPKNEQDCRLTHSRLQTAKACLRKHYLCYELGWRPIQKAKPLRVGTEFHNGLDVYKQQLILGEPIDVDAVAQAVYTSYAESMPDNQAFIEDWEIEQAMVVTLLCGYIWRWSEYDSAIKYVASEKAFDMPIINPDSGRSSRTFTAAGKYDGAAELCDGRLAVVEHKTCSADLSPDSDFWKRLRIDSQISMYFLGANSNGVRIETVLYDATRKPTIKPKRIPTLDADGVKQVVNKHTGERLKNANGKWKQLVNDTETQQMYYRMENAVEYAERLRLDIAERPDFYYARQEIPRLQSDLEEFRYELQQWAMIIRSCQLKNHWPRNTQICIGFGKCMFFDKICAAGYDINSGIVPEGFECVENVHQELEE